jgi:hypothetical protein
MRSGIGEFEVGQYDAIISSECKKVAIIDLGSELGHCPAHFYGDLAVELRKNTIEIPNKNLPRGSVSIDPRPF